MHCYRLTVACWLIAAPALGQQPQRPATNQIANAVVRPISLEETVRLALQHNLGLQIERLSPEINRFNLAGSLAYWDPVFTLRGEQTFRSSAVV